MRLPRCSLLLQQLQLAHLLLLLLVPLISTPQLAAAAATPATAVVTAELKAAALELAPWLKAVRRELHATPELMYAEHNTSAALRRHLEAMGVAYAHPYAKTGIVARLGTGQPVIALRADIDALPIQEPPGLAFASANAGTMHACGHDGACSFGFGCLGPRRVSLSSPIAAPDLTPNSAHPTPTHQPPGHMTMLLGAAKLLKARETELQGSVLLVFQPAEEGGAGADVMIQEGAIDGASAAYALHVWPALPTGSLAWRSGTIMAGVSQLWVLMFVGVAGGACCLLCRGVLCDCVTGREQPLESSQSPQTLTLLRSHSLTHSQSLTFKFTVRGRGGHAAIPHRNIDPVPAAAALIQALQTLVSRETSPLGSTVLSITQLQVPTRVCGGACWG
jgi:metal-dependent amidase/aminoacylase/carboxypeptidase family protein